MHRFGLFRLTLLITMAMASLGIVTTAYAQLFETRAGQAVLFDVDSGSILFSKDADKPIPPASLAKLMTMEVVFHAISIGTLNLDDRFLVSENAWRTGGAASGGSTMFAELNAEIRVEDLIKGVIVQSANDGCIILAEGIAGSEKAFAQLMNQRAAAIGLQSSNFVNSSGLPAPDQFVSVRDLIKLAVHMEREYPEFFAYYALTEFEWNNINQRNRNPLLRMDIGADGMKTGFTEESGYAIVGSTKGADGRRLFVAMSGLSDERERASEARKILEWGRRSFTEYEILAKDDIIGHVDVYGGATSQVAVRPAGSLQVLLPIVGNANAYRQRIHYQFPLRAPIQEGDEVAALRFYLDDDLAFEAPLVAAQSVDQGPVYRQALDALIELATGWIPDKIGR